MEEERIRRYKFFKKYLASRSDEKRVAAIGFLCWPEKLEQGRKG